MLHDRIRAVVEERLRIARAANPSPWRRFVGRTGLNHLDPNTIFGDGEPRGFDRLRNVCNLDYSWERDANAEHIMANDPADAILAAEHALGILARHEAVLDELDRLVCGGCQELCHSRSGLSCDSPDAPWPCAEVRALATRFGVEVSG